MSRPLVLWLALPFAALGGAPRPDPGSAAVAPAFTISGSVIDATGNPVKDASLAYQPDREKPDAALAASTDASGAFTLAVPRAGELGRLEISAPGFGSTLVDRVPVVGPVLALGPLRLLAPATLDGIVVGADGKPVPGARIAVSLEPDERLRRSGRFVTATAGADGKFRIEDLPAAQLAIEVSAAGRTMRQESADLRDGTSDSTKPVRFVLPNAATSGQSGSTKGRVVDGSGTPVAGARVERVDGTFDVWSTNTGADGRFELAALDSPVTLLVHARGRAAARFDAKAIAAGDLVLPAGHSVRLRVAKDPDVGLVTAIHLDVFTRSGEGWKREEGLARIEDATVDDVGAWTIGVPKGDRARLRLTVADGRESLPIEIDLAAPPPRGFDLEVALPSFGSLRGKVVGPTGQAITGIAIELGRPTELSLDPRPWRAVSTDGEGKFAFDRVPPGSYALRAVNSEAVSEPRLVTLGNEPVPDLELTASVAPRVTGKLTVNGAPPKGAYSLVAMRYHRLGASGSFAPAATTISAADGGYVLAPLPVKASVVVLALRPFEVADGAWHDLTTILSSLDVRNAASRANLFDSSPVTLDLDAKFATRSYVFGTLFVNGVPRPAGRLAVREKGIKGQPTPTPTVYLADAHGSYRIPLDGPGPFEFALLEGSIRTRGDLEFEPGGRREFDIRVDAGVVRGRFTLGAASPGPVRAILESAATDEEVLLRRANPSNLDDTPWANRGEAAVEADGTYRFTDVEVGTYRVAIEDVGRMLARAASAPFPVGVGETTVPDLEVPVGTTLVVEMKQETEDGTRLPFASAKVVAAEGASPLPRTFVGWFVGAEAKVDGLPPGRVKVDVVAFGKWKASAPQEVEIPGDGAPLHMVFTVSPRE